MVEELLQKRTFRMRRRKRIELTIYAVILLGMGGCGAVFFTEAAGGDSVPGTAWFLIFVGLVVRLVWERSLRYVVDLKGISEESLFWRKHVDWKELRRISGTESRAGQFCSIYTSDSRFTWRKMLIPSCIEGFSELLAIIIEKGGLNPGFHGFEEMETGEARQVAQDSRNIDELFIAAITLIKAGMVNDAEKCLSRIEGLDRNKSREMEIQFHREALDRLRRASKKQD